QKKAAESGPYFSVRSSPRHQFPAAPAPLLLPVRPQIPLQALLRIPPLAPPPVFQQAPLPDKILPTPAARLFPAGCSAPGRLLPHCIRRGIRYIRPLPHSVCHGLPLHKRRLLLLPPHPELPT